MSPPTHLRSSHGTTRSVVAHPTRRAAQSVACATHRAARCGARQTDGSRASGVFDALRCGAWRVTMAHDKRLSELIGDIYDAAIDPGLWNDVVGRAGFFVGGQVATIFAKSPIAGNGYVYYESGIDPEYRKLYFEKYLKLDPTTAGQYFADVGQPVAVADLMPYNEFQETRFYNEWVKPQGLVDFVSAVLDKSATTAAMFGVFRYERDGIVDDDTRARMRLIVPHIRRAVLIGRLIDLKAAESASFADTLDGMSSGLCMVDGAGRIMHANAACQRILDAGDPLFTVEGRIAARDVRADQALQEVFAASRGGDA